MSERDLILSAFMSEMFQPIEDDVDTAVELTHPVGEFFQKAEFGETPDLTWIEEVGTAPAVELSKSFLRKSDARLARTEEKIRANPLFQGHEEELEEVIRIAREMRDEARTEVLEVR